MQGINTINWWNKRNCINVPFLCGIIIYDHKCCNNCTGAEVKEFSIAPTGDGVDSRHFWKMTVCNSGRRWGKGQLNNRKRCSDTKKHYQEKLWDLHPQAYSKFNWIWPRETWFSFEAACDRWCLCLKVQAEQTDSPNQHYPTVLWSLQVWLNGLFAHGLSFSDLYITIWTLEWGSQNGFARSQYLPCRNVWISLQKISKSLLRVRDEWLALSRNV